eukprot:3853882-Pleurochrysis_carterae.AAC.2
MRTLRLVHPRTGAGTETCPAIQKQAPSDSRVPELTGIITARSIKHSGNEDVDDNDDDHEKDDQDNDDHGHRNNANKHDDSDHDGYGYDGDLDSFDLTNGDRADEDDCDASLHLERRRLQSAAAPDQAISEKNSHRAPNTQDLNVKPIQEKTAYS